MPEHFSKATKAYDAKQDLPLGAYTLWHGMGFGMLYQITGEKKYAALGRECVQKAFDGVRDTDDRLSWMGPAEFMRAGPSMSAIAEAYDLCYDGWDPDFRQKVALEIQEWAIPAPRTGSSPGGWKESRRARSPSSRADSGMAAISGNTRDPASAPPGNRSRRHSRLGR
jgi:hypothetical protein